MISGLHPYCRLWSPEQAWELPDSNRRIPVPAASLRGGSGSSEKRGLVGVAAAVVYVVEHLEEGGFDLFVLLGGEQVGDYAPRVLGIDGREPVSLAYGFV